MSKTILQKAYEKMSMLKYNSEKLVLIGAYDATGKPMLILALAPSTTSFIFSV